MSQPNLPLAGVVVLDLSRLLPGAYGSLLLADLGADIIKIEDLKGGDYMRWIPPLVDQYGVHYHATNRNKRSVGLDLAAPKGKAVFRRLAARADVVLESFRPGVMDRLGLGYPILQAHNPRLVYCAISGYGQDGPYRRRVGHDLNYIAIAGLLGATGEAGGPPVMPAVQIADLGGSYAAAVGILAALVGRGTDGRGRRVDISMTEVALSFMTTHLARHWFSGPAEPRGQGMLSGGLACYNIYPTRDGKYLALGALEPKFWSAFLTRAGRGDLIDRQMDEDQAALHAEVAAIVHQRTRDEWMALLEGHEVCCEPVYAMAEVAADPQLQAREVLLRDPGVPVIHVRTPVRLPDGPTPQPRTAPAYGADTRPVLREFGFTDAEIADLQAAGIVPAGH